MLAWFNTKAAKEFGVSLASTYINCVPPAEKLSEKKLVAFSRQALAKMGRELDNFKNNNKLNIYKTAKMGNAFKWALKDAGYNDNQIDKLTEWLMAAAR